MSATMFYGSTGVRPCRWICGVCADLAERSALPVAVPRIAFAVFAVLHLFLACILYFGLAWLLGPGRTCGISRTAPPPPRPRDDFGPVSERFRNLDQRLSRLEAATANSEAELRRAFRDLEGRR